MKKIIQIVNDAEFHIQKGTCIFTHPHLHYRQTQRWIMFHYCSQRWQAFLTFPGVLGHIHPKLNDVPREHLTGRALLRPPAQTLAVDKGTIAAFGVLEIELCEERRDGKITDVSNTALQWRVQNMS